jgi:signal transduction histidine kinase
MNLLKFNPLPSLSIKTRLALLAVALMFGAVWALVLPVKAMLRAEFEQLLAEQLAATTGYIAADLDHEMRARIDALNRISGAITEEMMADPHKLQQLLDGQVMFGTPANVEVFITDRNGVLIADYPLNRARLGRSMSDRPGFIGAVASGKLTVTAPTVGRFPPFRPLVQLANPLRDRSGGIMGVAILPVVLSDHDVFGLLEQAKLGKSGYFLVASPKERLFIYATDPSRIMEPVPAKGVNALFDRRLEEGFEGPGVTVSVRGVQVMSVSRRLPTTGWILIAGVATEEIYAPVARLENRIQAIALILSLVIAVILWIVVGRQLAPLKEAGMAMRRMTAGTAPLAEIPTGGADEISELKDDFNRLVAMRRQVEAERQAEIDQHRKTEQSLEKTASRLRLLSEGLTEDQEAQRMWLARELHEQLGQDLIALRVQLQMLAGESKGKGMQSWMNEAAGVTSSMLERLRTLSLELHPSELDDFGLSPALGAYCRQQADAAGWALHYDARMPEERLPSELELACFRVAQEALVNAVTHARATEIWVELRDSGTELSLSVRDNGVGFDVASTRDNASHGTIGLIRMEERVTQIGGSLEIRSDASSGTEIRATFPHAPVPVQAPGAARAIDAGAARG